MSTNSTALISAFVEGLICSCSSSPKTLGDDGLGRLLELALPDLLHPLKPVEDGAQNLGLVAGRGDALLGLGERGSNRLPRALMPG
jgi:hypothetical protein